MLVFPSRQKRTKFWGETETNLNLQNVYLYHPFIHKILIGSKLDEKSIYFCMIIVLKIIYNNLGGKKFLR